ncbi:MAG TPA: NapC/NirT family cytochrome c [Candidatus Methylacidiphilales bacterium]|nr:NapC/NirT family cytochrome c [Candidatus Methylacidiphilales bacterium]
MPEESTLLPRPPKLLYNWISLIGAVFAVGSIFAFLLLFAIELFLPHGNPYMGILVYVVAPICFFAGFFLILAGVWAQRNRQVSERLQLQIDVSRPRDRKLLAGFALGVLIFLLVTAFGSYQTFHYTESVEFCGAACHVPMHPEYMTYLRSPHARVACVECHVGAGAEWYVRSKLNGMHQLFDVVTGNIPRPIETPVKNLRPARDTCEECHWPERFIGNIDRTFYHYLSDDTNTPFAVRLLLKVGGGGANTPPSGIHWHVSRGEKVEYIATDAQRQVIPWVRVSNLTTGETTVYRDKNFHDDPAKYTVRTMDCIDCHTRPAHQFQTPYDAVDEAITAGRLDRSIPKLKFNVVTALVASYQTTGEAMQKIASSLHAAYPNLAGVEGVIAEVQEIYRNNFFPEMKTDWRVHPDNIGHKNWPGCFRCHDGNHKTDDGQKTIAADNCNQCHIILAQGSGDQLKQLKADGYDFVHIDSTYLDFSCTSCHTGAFTK